MATVHQQRSKLQLSSI